MDISRLKYSKEDGTLDFREERMESAISGDVQHPLENRAPSLEGYQKDEPTQDPSFLFIISGGEKREKDYFSLLKQDVEIAKRLKVVFVSKKEQGMSPEAMWEEAEEDISESSIEEDGKVYTIMEGDEIYLLSDVDEFMPSLQKLLPLCSKDFPCRWIISNPAFEMWLFYHVSDSLDLLSACIGLGANKRSQWLKNQLNELVPGGVNPIQAIKDMPTAMFNSQRHYEEENKLPKLFSTQMHILASHILSILGNTFHQMLERQQEKARRFLENNGSL